MKKHSPKKRKSQQEKSGFSDVWAGALGAVKRSAKGSKGKNDDKKGLKRVETRSGQTYYFENGKRINAKTGAKKYVARFFEQIKTLSPETFAALTEGERRSFRSKVSAEKNADKLRQEAADRFRFRGRLIPKYLQDVLDVTVLELVGRGEKELTKVFPNIRDYGDLLRVAQGLVSTLTLKPTEWALPNEKRRRETYFNIIDIAERVIDPPVGRLCLRAIDESGKVTEGNIEALEVIREWEEAEVQAIIAAGGNPAYVKFTHSGVIDVEDATFTIDLSESRDAISVQFSP